MSFESAYAQILKRVDSINPTLYAETRNFKDGAVSRMSPYLSRGVVSTRFVKDQLLRKGLSTEQLEKYIQELAWRDYWQLVWMEKGEGIDRDLKREQEGVSNHEISAAICKAKTGIQAVDEAIKELEKSGYMHNHMRMYVASMACNIAGSHWYLPAQWMYYHLLDGDWASNALSWQWVAGSNSNKKYYANQENINRFFYTKQKGTFLDYSYEELPLRACPEILMVTHDLELKTSLPESDLISINREWPTLIYNYYNLDPTWRASEKANRIILLEPSLFEKYAVSKQCIDFALKLAENIQGARVFVGEFDEFQSQYQVKNIIYKEHPLNKHYRGKADDREFMFSVRGYYPSFFAYWKKCKKEMEQW